MKKILALVLVTCLLLALNVSAFAADKTYELKLSTTQTDTSMIYAGMKAAADKILADTDGHVVVTIYPSGQLGVEEDMIDQALQGMGIAVLTDAGRMSSYVNDMGILNMAYFVDNYEDGVKVMNTDTFKAWDEELHKHTPGAAPYSKSIEALGATPYNIAWGEVYNGIQTKAIDGCEVQNTSAVSSKIYEVCEVASMTEHINLFNFVVCGQAWFDKLPAEYQEIVEKDFQECAYQSAQEVIAAQADLIQTLKDNGMEIVEVDKEVFKDAAKSAYEALGWTELREQLYKEAGLQ